MKKIIMLALLFVLLAPTLSQAQVTTKSTDAAQMQLIISLLEQIKVLQAQLDKMLKDQSKSTPSTVNIKEYQNKVEPLLDELEEKEDKIELLEEKIEQERCNEPKWTYVKGERSFKCLDVDGVEPETNEDIDELEDNLDDLEDEKEEIEEEIEKLKTRYGI